MTTDRDVNAKLNLVPNPAIPQLLAQLAQTINTALSQANQGRPLLEMEADAEAANAALTKVANSGKKAAGGVGGGTGGVSASGGLGAVGAGVGQLASIAGVSGQAGGAIGLLGSNIGALGPIGAGVATGMVALGVIFKELKSIGEELQRQEELLIKARFTAIDLAGQTSDDLIKKEEELAEARERQAQKVAFAREEVERLDRSGVEGFFKDIGDGVGIWSDQLTEAKDTLKETEKELDSMDAELKGVRDALNSTETAAADAAQALEDAARAREKAVLEEVDALGSLIKASQAAAERTREGNRDRLKEIAKEERVLKAQIAALKESGVSGEEAAAKMKSLNAALKGLGNETQQVTRAIRDGTEADREAARERAREQQQEAQERRNAARERARERAQERREEENERIKGVIDFMNKVTDIEYNAAKNRYDIQVQANRDQERLLREAAHAFEQDFDQDFLGAFQRQRDLAFQLSETQIATNQQLTDVDTRSYLEQQQLRAQTPGAQQLLNPPASVVINAGTDLNAVTAHLQSIGLVPA